MGAKVLVPNQLQNLLAMKFPGHRNRWQVYADAEVYVLDDPLSALDAHVGKKVFMKCILGKLKDRTRILVTNQLQYLHLCDNMVTLLDGRAVETGTVRIQFAFY